MATMGGDLQPDCMRIQKLLSYCPLFITVGLLCCVLQAVSCICSLSRVISLWVEMIAV
jgi:hypothetical protein